MKLLYGTTNTAKLHHMRQLLEGLDIEIVGPEDLNRTVATIDESGNNPLENAKLKATAYYEAIRMPVFSCDSGLYIEGLDEEDQPGVHIRRVHGKTLNDSEMITHYSNLAAEVGGLAKAYYQNAICLVLDENRIYLYDGEDISECFYLSQYAHSRRIAGFPLDSLSIEPNTKKYYFDLDNQEKPEDTLKNGFRKFFSNIMGTEK